jgi:2,3-bisphosphoglycerate-independent phosphoglycerate mutase
MSIIVLKGLLGADDAQSFFGDIEGFRRIGIGSKIHRFELEPDEVLEAALLGHSNLVLDQGPLTVAALGANPPERSLHFHVSMMSVQVDQIQFVRAAPTPEEQTIIRGQLDRLNTKTLSVLIGEGLDHGMVCDRRIELRTTRPSEAVTNGLHQSLPSGDGENDMRRFIDDSVNLLAEQEFNARRMDKGLLPINLCWPWGQGERQRIPNRAIELGRPWTVRARSLATRGLARLSGFQPEKISLFADLNFREFLTQVKTERDAVSIVDFGVMPIGEESEEELRARLAEFGQLLIEPLLDWQLDSKTPLCFVITSRTNEGLIAFIAKTNERDIFPFDERSLSDRKVPRFDLKQILDVASL